MQFFLKNCRKIAIFATLKCKEMMKLEHLSIVNYKNIREAEIDFSGGVNCLVGNNGMGKTNLLDAIESEQSTPSLSQAQRMKKFSAEGSLTLDMMRAILSEEKKPVRRQVVINLEELKDKIPPNYTDEQIQQVLVKLFTQWAQKQNKQQEG